MTRSRIIGLTGGSGVGKGEVCRILAERGALIIDTDSIGHMVIKRGQPAYNEVLAEFGDGILTDNENYRKKLGSVVFGDKIKLEKLSRIVHKYIIEETLHIIKTAENSLIVIDAPVLIEANMAHVCDVVVGVFANRNIRIERIMARDSITAEAAERRIGSQMPDEELARHVDISIQNNGNLAELKEKLTHALSCDKMETGGEGL